MVGCLEGSAIAGCAGFGAYQVKARRDRRNNERWGHVRRLSNKVLREDAPKAQHATYKRVTFNDPGLNDAFKIVNGYLFRKAPPTECQVPSCSAGPLQLGGQAFKSGPDHQTILCEDLKSFIEMAAANTVEREKVQQRIEFYYGLMMRPEIFSDPDFMKLLAEVVEKLELFEERNFAQMRTVEKKLGDLHTLGRQLVDAAMPVLTLALLDVVGKGHIVNLNASELVRSYRDRDYNIFTKLWLTEAGQILIEILLTPHCTRMWDAHDIGNEHIKESAMSESSRKITEKRLELFHKWQDEIVEEPHKLQEQTGFFWMFNGEEHQKLHEEYLNTLQRIDDFCAFVYMVERFQELAKIGGDVGMHILRDGLHHVMREVEVKAAELVDGLLRIAGEAKKMVSAIILKNAAPEDKIREWIERLQWINEQEIHEIDSRIMVAIKEVRLLSAEARLPQLQHSCLKNLETLSELTNSKEFQQRCKELPPPTNYSQGMLQAGPAPAALPQTLVDKPVSQYAVEEVESALPASSGSAEILYPTKSGKHLVELSELNEGLADEKKDVATREEPEGWQAPQYNPFAAEAPPKKASAEPAVEASTAAAAPPEKAATTEPAVEASTAAAPREKTSAKPQIEEQTLVTTSTSSGVTSASSGTAATAASTAAAPEGEEPPVTDEEESSFYEFLVNLYEDLSVQQAMILFTRAEGLSNISWLQKRIREEAGSEGIDRDSLQRIGRAVALAQSGTSASAKECKTNPGRLPKIEGLVWNRKKRRLTVLPDLMEALG